MLATRLTTLSSLVITASLAGGSILPKSASSGQDPEPLNDCCAPAIIESEPLNIGCDGDCFNAGNSTEKRAACGRDGDTSGVQVSYGDCLLTGEEYDCATSACVLLGADEYTCRLKLNPAGCQSGEARCVWELSGTFDQDYADCTGQSCWGGAMHTACQ